MKNTIVEDAKKKQFAIRKRLMKRLSPILDEDQKNHKRAQERHQAALEKREEFIPGFTELLLVLLEMHRRYAKTAKKNPDNTFPLSISKFSGIVSGGGEWQMRTVKIGAGTEERNFFIPKSRKFDEEIILLVQMFFVRCTKGNQLAGASQWMVRLDENREPTPILNSAALDVLLAIEAELKEEFASIVDQLYYVEDGEVLPAFEVAKHVSEKKRMELAKAVLNYFEGENYGMENE